ncbi:LysR family transcriptional regulator [Fusibacter sp. 3D3]|uniref:LysR family transcriptional regulator n=1 Tax=Fusibacter sp. 3D3 TaxID=1048380 RepID=UPI0008535902|nr:LysR family transcriptional regulator [Fusibacter sp. 3D3]GAU75530.1 transcriptional regulator [Fusibacter sp. 3D3]
MELYPNINFELYKFFYFAADELNFSKAAQNLHVTQSAVSQSIKSLESQLEVTLFFRQGRNIRLTFEGEVLFKHIEKAFNFIRSAENSLNSIKSLDEGTVFIGASDTITRYLLLSKIKSFNAIYPKVKLSINNRPSPRSVERLKNGEIDIAIINLNPNVDYEGLEVTPFSTIDNIFIATHTYLPMIPFTKLSLKEVSAHPLICLEEKSTTRKILEEFYKANQLKVHPSFEFGSLEVILEAVKSNMGIGFVSKNVAEQDLNTAIIREVQIIEEIPQINVGILTNKSKPLSLATQKFLNILLEKES